MTYLRRDRRSPFLPLIVIAFVSVAGATGCTPGNAPEELQPAAVDRLEFENLSPDAVRVSVYTGDYEILLGRVGPVERASFVLRVLPSESRDVCLLVVPVGAPSVTKPGPLSAGAIQSEHYPVSQLARQMWTYSGSRIVVARVPTRGG